MRYKKKILKGQFFVISAVIFVFLVYLFSEGVLRQTNTASHDVLEMEQVEEVLNYCNNIVSNLNFTNKNETYLELLYLQKYIDLVGDMDDLKSIKLEYTYNKSISRWNISLIVNTPSVHLIKEWK